MDNPALPTIKSQVSLKADNTFGLDVQAEHLAKITDDTELHALLTDTHWRAQPKFILGGGSNVLFTQDLPGLVIKNAIDGIEVIDEDDAHIWLRIGAGMNWHELVMHCVEHDYAGIENLALIPGTVGAAPMQNIGAYGVELRSVFHELEAMRIDDGSCDIFTNAMCQFGYRNSIFKTTHKNQYIITHVTLRLNKHAELNLSYGAVQETLEHMGVKEPSIRSVCDAVIHIRQSKLPDPKKIGNAGSFFKNPVINNDQFNFIQKEHPDIPHYSNGDTQTKIPAAWLIEQCGFKGKRVGNVGVHDKQALVLVNFGDGHGDELRDLAEKIQLEVAKRFAIQLQAEVNII